MTERQLKLKKFYEDKNNWRPPSYSQIAKYMGYTKAAAYKELKKLLKNEGNTAT